MVQFLFHFYSFLFIFLYSINFNVLLTAKPGSAKHICPATLHSIYIAI